MNNLTLTPAGKTIVGVQFLFVAFGSTVLVPLLIGLDPATALLTAGVGTFIFHLVTKGVVPIFLGSSFAFIAPVKEALPQSIAHFQLPHLAWEPFVFMIPVASAPVLSISVMCML